MTDTTVTKTRQVRLWITALAFLSLYFSLTMPGLASAQAASGTISLGASAASVSQGNQFTITITAAADEPISGAQAYVTYDTTKLSFVSVDYSMAIWNQDTGDTGGGTGYYQVSRFKLPSYPASGQLARLTFQADATGSTTIRVTASKSLVYSGNTGQNILGSISGTNVTVNPPAAAAEAPSPGTAKPATDSTPAVYTPPTESSMAEAVAAATPAEAIDPAASDAGEAVLLAGKERDDAAGQLASTTTGSKLPVPLLGALGLFVMVGVGIWVIRLHSSKNLPLIQPDDSVTTSTDTTSDTTTKNTDRF